MRLGQPEQGEQLLNGLLPELRRRHLPDTDHVGGDFRANLALPALQREAAPACAGERTNGRAVHRAPRSAVRRCAISRDQISIEKITIWYTHVRALQSGLLPAAPPVVSTLFQKFAT
ncbi:hypothetical protein [Burkholderia territorii]|uniref:hypothetical protein n=1 Tax=Burkholderia territorii TaxID=1503055 RepID=UPI001E2F434B|nr:hypothetical protein [Burkholderia territorii]